MRRRSLMGTMARTAVITKTATTVAGNTQAKQQAQQAAAQQPAVEAAQAPVASAADTQILEIQKFASLKDQGVLTEEEFQAKKRQILGL